MTQKINTGCILTKLISLFLICIWLYYPSSQCNGQDVTPLKNKEFAGEKPFTFGVVADIQYADKDSLRERYYRSAINNLKECVADMNAKDLLFTIQLGDIIDGQRENPGKTHQDLDSIVGIINHLNTPLYHVIGNHDMIAGKEYLQESLGIKDFYYDFTFPSAKGWRFIVLDGNDAGYGIISESQVAWFTSVIDMAEKNKERVICFCHYAVVPGPDMHHYLAQSEPILKILDNTSCVKAWFAGHDHKGGYAYRNSVHHITIRGMVEAPAQNSYATVELSSDKIRITGTGKEESRELKF